MDESAPFAYMDADAFPSELLPRFDAFFAQSLLIHRWLSVEFQRPGWLRPGIGAVNPVGFVMTDLHRVVTSRALGDAQLDEAVDRIATPAEAVGDDQALRIFRAI